MIEKQCPEYVSTEASGPNKGQNNSEFIGDFNVKAGHCLRDT